MLNERFYGKFGYGFIPTSTLHFRKIIGLTPLKQKIQALGVKLLHREKFREALAKKPLTINLNIESLPAFHVVMTDQAFTVSEDSHEQSNLTVTAPYAVILSLTMGHWQVLRSLLVNALVLRLRVGGLMRTSGRLLSLAWGLARSRGR